MPRSAKGRPYLRTTSASHFGPPRSPTSIAVSTQCSATQGANRESPVRRLIIARESEHQLAPNTNSTPRFDLPASATDEAMAWSGSWYSGKGRVTGPAFRRAHPDPIPRTARTMARDRIHPAARRFLEGAPAITMKPCPVPMRPSSVPILPTSRLWPCPTGAKSSR